MCPIRNILFGKRIGIGSWLHDLYFETQPDSRNNTSLRACGTKDSPVPTEANGKSPTDFREDKDPTSSLAQHLENMSGQMARGELW